MSKNHHLLKRKHWIFDLDGTLTIAVHDFNAIRKELGIPEGQPIIKTLESLPAKESRKQKKKLQEIEEMLALNASPAPVQDSHLTPASLQSPAASSFACETLLQEVTPMF